MREMVAPTTVEREEKVGDFGSFGEGDIVTGGRVYHGE
jgi:hypothetical protein